VSKVNDIKNMKRQQKAVTPAQALAEAVGEEQNDIHDQRREEKKVERKRVSFDLRTDLHKELKFQALMKEKNIYILIEEALEKYLKESK
jgi:hypothetical protein